MTLNDTLSTALSAINNNEKVGKKICVLHPVSEVMKSVFSIMQNNHYLGEVKEQKHRSGESVEVNLLGSINKCGAIKPRFSVQKDEYEKFEKRYLPAKGVGLLVVSTPQGILTHHEAKKKNTGGKLLAYVY